MNRVKLYILLILSVFLVITFNSCTGCSRSGKHSIAKNNQSRSRRTRDKEPERGNNTPEVQEPENIEQEPIEITEHNPNNKKSISQLFKELEKSVFMVFALNNSGNGAQGSGFFINSEGIGITNYHVLEGYKNKMIQTSDGQQYSIIEILKTSTPENNDYVIFKVDSKGHTFKSLNIAHTRTPIGEDVFAIGSPKGLENSLTKGSVSQYRDNNRIQIDATIDHGSSGGPLFNLNGELIGVTTSGIEGSALNFAVDIQAIPYNQYVKKN